MMKVDEVDFSDGVFTSRKSNAQPDDEGCRQGCRRVRESSGWTWSRASSPMPSSPARAPNYPNGCHIVELEIDEETGVVDFVRYNVVDDVGVVLNPLLLKGQIQGGIAQGIGQMLMEDIKFDPQTGELLTGSFMDYAMPHADNICSIEVNSHPVPTKTNLLGVKGAGEAGCVGALPAVANALADALSPLGVKDVPMPATPHVIWRIIQEARQRL